MLNEIKYTSANKTKKDNANEVLQSCRHSW